jgi:hypothetical protein
MAPPPLPDVLPLPSLPQAPNTHDDGPALPLPLPTLPHFPVPRSLKPGCWLLNYKPINSPLVAYDGTLRIEAIDGGRRASGDLYQRPTIKVRIPGPGTPFPIGGSTIILAPPPNPADGIPIRAIDKYAYFLRVTKILESITIGESFELGLEMFTFSHTTSALGRWGAPLKCTATMTWMPGATPAGFPSRSHYLEGDLKADNGNVLMGRLKMGWVSDFFRKATIEIDTVAGSERPLDSGAGHDWSTVGAGMGYDLKLVESQQDVPEMTGNSWSNAEMHAAMLAHRDSADLNREWRYHILAVKMIDETERGIMYDNDATDSNNVPREGVGISTHWIIPDQWGSSSGMRFGLAKAAHFRTAVHELGHAFGLYHNTIDLGFMNTSDVIARAGNTGSTPFPDNIKWAFADNDLKRLRHRPDIYIRPGGVPFGDANDLNPLETPDDRALALDMPELKLELTPLRTELPLGAPVRIELKLSNKSDTTIPIPKRIDLKSNCIRGVVTDPSGKSRTFKSLFGCLDEEPLVDLKQKSSVTKSLTLLRGGEGALFPSSGISTITVQIRWALPSAGEAGPIPEAVVSGSTTVLVMGPHTGAHAKSAHKVLTSPDLQLLMALGGTHLTGGIEAVEAAMNCDVLAPHWNVVQAKSLAKTGNKQYGRDLLGREGECVMSHDEKQKLERLLK